jgi:hypothetical protein
VNLDTRMQANAFRGNRSSYRVLMTQKPSRRKFYFGISNATPHLFYTPF